MVGTFIVSWTPYSVLALMETFGNFTISPAIATIPSLFAKTSVVFNPLVYGLLNTQVKLIPYIIELIIMPIKIVLLHSSAPHFLQLSASRSTSEVLAVVRRTTMVTAFLVSMKKIVNALL